MANNYLQFSEMLEDLSEKEVTWLKFQLDTDPDTGVWRFLKGKQGLDCPEECGFEFKFEEQDSDQTTKARRALWLYAGEYGEPERVALLVQKFLKAFRPTASWGLTYACTCSKMRIGEFSGGGVFVTAKSIRHFDAGNLIWSSKCKFEKRISKQTTPN